MKPWVWLSSVPCPGQSQASAQSYQALQNRVLQAVLGRADIKQGQLECRSGPEIVRSKRKDEWPPPLAFLNTASSIKTSGCCLPFAGNLVKSTPASLQGRDTLLRTDAVWGLELNSVYFRGQALSHMHLPAAAKIRHSTGNMRMVVSSRLLVTPAETVWQRLLRVLSKN